MSGQIHCPHKPQDQLWVWGDSDSSDRGVCSGEESSSVILYVAWGGG